VAIRKLWANSGGKKAKGVYGLGRVELLITRENNDRGQPDNVDK